MFYQLPDMTENKLPDVIRELAFQNEEKGKRAAELIIVNKELVFQNEEKEKLLAELRIANKELAFQNNEKEKRAGELDIANKELAFQDDEKGKRAEELTIANKELVFQNNEKEKRAAELRIANKELAFQNNEKEKRAGELRIANIELAFQNDEKEKRAEELTIANKELAFQNDEKEKRAAELIIANYARSLIEASLDPLVTISAAGKILDVNEASIKVTGVPREKLIDTDFSNYFTEPTKAQEGYRRVFEKGFVADYPLTIKHKNGNLTDVLYNASVYKDDKGNVLGVFAAARDVTEQKWAKDLRIANKELAFQNEEKEKRAAELIIVNKELESFTYISSHDLQEPLRKIQIFSARLIDGELKNLSDKGKEYVLRMNDAASRMQTLIVDLLTYSRTTSTERKFETTDLNTIIESVKKDFAEIIAEKNAVITADEMCDAHIIHFQFRQLMLNLIGNSLKFSKPRIAPHIVIKSSIVKGSTVNNQHLLPEKDYCHITITDNGIGFEPQYKDHIFELFKRLHDKEKITGTGIGLTIVKRIVENHNGVIVATSELNKGATFDIYIPST